MVNCSSLGCTHKKNVHHCRPAFTAGRTMSVCVCVLCNRVAYADAMRWLKNETKRIKFTRNVERGLRGYSDYCASIAAACCRWSMIIATIIGHINGPPRPCDHVSRRHRRHRRRGRHALTNNVANERTFNPIVVCVSPVKIRALRLYQNTTNVCMSFYRQPCRARPTGS